MSLNHQQYSNEYFANYKIKGRFLKRERGERWYQFGYWQRYISRHFRRGSTILEIGCGLGYFGKVLFRKFEYVGTDIAIFPLQAIRSREKAISLVQGNVLTLGFRPESFDVVVAFDILEHISPPTSAILEIYRVLRKDGRLILTVPNVNSLGNRIKLVSEGLVPSMYVDKTHLSLLSAEKWTCLFAESGFKILRVASDTLWDIPYSKKFPVILQKMFLIPCNIFIASFFGGLPWSLGENLVFICEK